MIGMDNWQGPVYVEDLTCLKSKYLSFFSLRRDFRHAGMDVTIKEYRHRPSIGWVRSIGIGPELCSRKRSSCQREAQLLVTATYAQVPRDQQALAVHYPND